MNASRILLDLDHEVRTAATAQRVRRVAKRVRNLQEMVRHFGPTDDADVRDLADRVKDTLAKLSALDPVGHASENLAGLNPFDRDKAVALEMREMRGLFDLKTPPGAISTGTEEWHAWWQSFFRWIRGRFLRS